MNNLMIILANGDTLKICDSYNVLLVFYFIKQLLTLICIFVPIILIVMLCVDVFKTVVAGNVSDEIKKMSGRIVKRVVMCFIFFLIPTIINLIASIIGFINYDATKCWKNATRENVESMKKERDNTIKQEENAQREMAQKEEERKKREAEISQAKLEEAQNNSNNSSNSNNSAGGTGNTNIATNGKLIFLGDSRTVGLKNVGKSDADVSFVCEGGMGYNWFINTAIDEVNKIATTDGYTILFNLGVNGTVKENNINTTEAGNYVSKIKELSSGAWSKHKIVIVSVFPINDSTNKYNGLNDAGVVKFNEYMKTNLSNISNVTYCDVYNGLSRDKYVDGGDGLHYAPEGYRNIYKYMKENCR